VRDYWRGERSTIGELANRLTGSSDLYESDGRRPLASINFVTAHDGFTLRDLVSYDEPHNEANGEEAGEPFNRSWNGGVEGETNDAVIRELRARQRRNLLLTLMLSQGVPMLLGGDELGRTQRGNNNAYSQDNDISWYDWDRADTELMAFVRRLIRLRLDHPVFRRRNWFAGHPIGQAHADDLPDIAWFAPDAQEMVEEQWREADAKSMAVFLNGQAITSRGRRGERITDDSFFLMFNAHDDAVAFTLPDATWGRRWAAEIDTAAVPAPGDEVSEASAGDAIKVSARSAVVLRRLDDTERA
jgi:glycogen operon protein